MIEKCLVEYCSATLASLKSGSLFNAAIQADKDFDMKLRRWRRCLAAKGIEVRVLRRREKSALIYVYRRRHLAETLGKPGVAEFLATYGYRNTDPEDALELLTERMRESDGFPHEIGIFLDYPLGDVVGFIENEGRNFKFVGNWKVYCDECECRRKFAQYKKCHDVYMRLWKQGRRTVTQLTVAA